VISLTPPEHQHTAAIDEAAQWLATTPRRQIEGAIVPALQHRFGLNAAEACAAIREVNLRRARAA
jgi:hypothetical protein